MNVSLTKRAQKDYRKLPLKIQKKADKQFSILIDNYRHPSLRSRKMSGRDVFEARIDFHYRFTFQIEEDIPLCIQNANL